MGAIRLHVTAAEICRYNARGQLISMHMRSFGGPMAWMLILKCAQERRASVMSYYESKRIW